MAARVITPEFLSGTTAYQDFTATPADTVRRLDLRASVIGSDDTVVSWKLLGPAAAGDMSGKNRPMEFEGENCVLDLERDLVVPEGWWIEVKCAANGDVMFRLTGTELDV